VLAVAALAKVKSRVGLNAQKLNSYAGGSDEIVKAVSNANRISLGTDSIAVLADSISFLATPAVQSIDRLSNR
jgi:hypothetical protein